MCLTSTTSDLNCFLMNVSPILYQTHILLNDYGLYRQSSMCHATVCIQQFVQSAIKLLLIMCIVIDRNVITQQTTSSLRGFFISRMMYDIKIRAKINLSSSSIVPKVTQCKGYWFFTPSLHWLLALESWLLLSQQSCRSNKNDGHWARCVKANPNLRRFGQPSMQLETDQRICSRHKKKIFSLHLAWLY